MTGGLQRLILPSFIPALLFGKPAAVDQLVVDDERHIMYALTSSSGAQGGGNSIQVRGGGRWLALPATAHAL